MRIVSVGYDEMKTPAADIPNHILSSDAHLTYTRERPIPGRSGGGLIDLDSGEVIGVCQGYEESGPARGMYVSHTAICQFLAQQGWTMPEEPQAPGGGVNLIKPTVPL